MAFLEGRRWWFTTLVLTFFMSVMQYLNKLFAKSLVLNNCIC